MTTISIIGLDIAKSSFAVHCSDASGRTVRGDVGSGGPRRYLLKPSLSTLKSQLYAPLLDPDFRPFLSTSPNH